MINAVGFYPDTDCKTLVAALAGKYKIPSSSLLCGNGADDLLYRLVFALKPLSALIIEPTFEEYNRALELVGCKVFHYQLNPDVYKRQVYIPFGAFGTGHFKREASAQNKAAAAAGISGLSGRKFKYHHPRL